MSLLTHWGLFSNTAPPTPPPPYPPAFFLCHLLCDGTRAGVLRVPAAHPLTLCIYPVSICQYMKGAPAANSFRIRYRAGWLHCLKWTWPWFAGPRKTFIVPLNSGHSVPPSHIHNPHGSSPFEPNLLLFGNGFHHLKHEVNNFFGPASQAVVERTVLIRWNFFSLR